MNVNYNACASVSHLSRLAQKVGAVALVVMATACVHSRVERTGRMQLSGGAEGAVQVLAAMPVDYEEVAVVKVEAEALASAARMEKHLVRKAALLGCDAVVNVVRSEKGAEAACVKQREGATNTVEPMVVARASDELRGRLAKAGAEGAAVLKVLAQSESRSGAEKAWPLRWYLETYPNSAFAADVAALFVPVSKTLAAQAPSAVRAQPALR